MQIGGNQKPDTCVGKGCNGEKKKDFPVLLLQKLEQFSVLSLYRILVALDCRPWYL